MILRSPISRNVLNSKPKGELERYIAIIQELEEKGYEAEFIAAVLYRRSFLCRTRRFKY